MDRSEEVPNVTTLIVDSGFDAAEMAELQRQRLLSVSDAVRYYQTTFSCLLSVATAVVITRRRNITDYSQPVRLITCLAVVLHLSTH